MHFKTLSGKEPAEAVLAEARKEVQALGRAPMLAIVIAGEYAPSQVYVNRKLKSAESVGVKTEVHRLPENVEEVELLKLVERLNKDKEVDGFIVQTPLPKHIHAQKVMDAIDPRKDVDGYHPLNLGKVLSGQTENMFPPATPFGVLRMLEHYDVKIEGKDAVVIGRSNTVGKPMAMLLLNKNATVTICHSKTKNLAAYTKNADILVVAAGVPNLLKATMVKEGAHIIDVGTSRIKVDGKDKVVGDVDFDNVIKVAHCSPVPGGVGPLTVAMLIRNTVKAANRRKN
jgi:methylenetetrahydrofolate dehydrogenase (NADP+)/methenyltetrahydrofolate cyclohydrolase